MSKNSLLVLSLLTVSMFLVLPVSAAKNVGFRANGKVLTYTNPGSPPTSMIVGGDWSISVSNFDPDAKTGDVKFKLYYREMNLILSELEFYAPVGSVDQFWMTLVELYSVDYVPGEWCVINGRFNVDKLAWRPEGSTPPRDWKYNLVPGLEGWVIISPSGLVVEIYPWDLMGSTTSMTKR